MSFTTKGQKKEAAEAKPLEGLDPQNQDVLDRLRAIEDAEKRVVERAIPEDKKLFIEKAVRRDRHNVHRFLVKLTPSMCRKENCDYDAAKEAGYKAGWDDEQLQLRRELMLPTGQTMQEALFRLLEFHTQTAHAVTNSHILTEEEALRRKQWAAVPGQFLTNPSKA